MGGFRLGAAAVIVASIACSLPAVAADAPMAVYVADAPSGDALKFKTDHYIFYSLQNIAAKGRMRLLDQFDDKIWKKDRTYRIAEPGLQYFGVPATKKVGKEEKPEKAGESPKAPEEEKDGLLRADAHLSWYEIVRDEQEERIRKIIRLRARNQFGTAWIKIDIGFGNTKRILLVPAAKADPHPSEPDKPKGTVPEIPAKVDHYQCYEITNAPDGPGTKNMLQVNDQVVPDGKQIRLFGAAKYFCAPVVKRRLKEGDDGKPIPDLKGLNNPDDHMIIYRIDGGFPVRSKKYMRDQFLDGKTINLFFSWWLGVPTQKLGVLQ